MDKSTVLISSLLSLAASVRCEAELSFNKDIRPILSNACFQCHGPDDKKRDADLRLDIAEGATRDLGGYSAIVPGNPEKSALLERVMSHDRDEVMPPPKSKKPALTAANIATLRQWITEGAKYEGHWAFQPISKSPPPPTKNQEWPRNGIDRFLLQKLEEAGVSPSPEASKAVLLRRVSLDLTGIPPSPEETAAFVSDARPDAYERAVDRLLASPHYGERWGRHWLDQARYADSNGYSIDGPRDMWPYRDWVTRALNEDMPFDRFTIEQIAGDQLPSATKSQLIASAFHRNTMINQEGGSNPEQFRNETVVDRVNTTGAVWLGLTVGCAQCHTHKYDPISHQEYFKLFAFFNSSTDINNTGQTVEVVPGEVLGTARAGVSPAQYKAATEKVAKVKREASERQQQWLAKLGKSAGQTPWSGAAVVNATTSSGRDYAVDNDGGIRFSQGAKGKETLVLELSTTLERLGAIRLQLTPEVVKDKTGISLNEFEVLLNGNSVPLVAALVGKDSAKSPAKASIDGDLKSAWTPEPTAAKDGTFEIWFLPASPIQTAGNTLSVRIKQETGAPLTGIVRVALAPEAPLLPPDLKVAEEALSALKASQKGDKLSAAQNNALKAAFAAVDGEQALADSQLEKLRKAVTPANLMVMKDLPQPRQTFLHVRGDYLSPDDKLGPLQPDTPAALPALAAPAEKRTRLELANWLVRNDNPLTPRVTVNRVWMRYFGVGLVETENDFGTQGTQPSHPELLDWLASEFIRNGWSFKALHKSIAMSATYRQSSNARPDLMERDPRNLWLARQNRVRLDAEIIRDSALKASGLLDQSVGGPPVFPPQPEGVYSFTQGSKPWIVSKGGDRYRRAMYTMFYRSAQHPLTSTFDAPNFSATCTRRLRSNTPLQALMLSNDETFFEMAQATALQLWKDVPGETPAHDRARVARAFERFFCRKPTAVEVEKSLLFLQRARTGFDGNPQAQAPPIPAFALPGKPAQESAAWTALARGLMNADEFITRE